MSKLTETLARLIAKPTSRQQEQALEILQAAKEGTLSKKFYSKLLEESTPEDPGLKAYGDTNWEGMNIAWNLMSIGAAFVAGRKPLPQNQDKEQYKLGIAVEREHLPELEGFEEFRDMMAELIASSHWAEDPEYYFADSKDGTPKVKGEKDSGK